MTTYLTPGVYVKEVNTTPGAIEGVGTSTAAFVGMAPDVRADVGRAVAVDNWTTFRRRFVGDKSSNDLSNAVYGFFENGGTRCYIVNLGDVGPVTGPGRGLELLEAIDEVAIVAAPGRLDEESQTAIVAHVEKMGDRVAILDGPSTWDDATELTERKKQAGDEPVFRRPGETSRAALYVPHLEMADPLGGERQIVPPSGHVAGVWARTDATRGVHKAPANEPVRGVLDVTRAVTKAEQGALNPAGVNVIRSFSRSGIRIWGARTLAASSDPYRYLPVRRLVTSLAESIEEGTRWVVFEPNDAFLHANIRTQIGSYLRRVWRSGALAGATPEEAFFVRCDAETNPPESVDAGEVRAVIGLAPVKPAEFVIFEITQQTAPTTEEGGA